MPSLNYVQIYDGLISHCFDSAEEALEWIDSYKGRFPLRIRLYSGRIFIHANVDELRLYDIYGWC